MTLGLHFGSPCFYTYFTICTTTSGQFADNTMGQTQSTGFFEESGTIDGRTDGRADYYELLGLERDASEDE